MGGPPMSSLFLYCYPATSCSRDKIFRAETAEERRAKKNPFVFSLCLCGLCAFCLAGAVRAGQARVTRFFHLEKKTGAGRPCHGTLLNPPLARKLPKGRPGQSRGSGL